MIYSPNNSNHVSLVESFIEDNGPVIYENGSIYRDCTDCITEEMIVECLGDPYLVQQSAILEAVKMDWTLKNYLKSGEDYRGLKKELREVMDANNIKEEDVASKGSKILHACLRCMQIICDIAPTIAAVDLAAGEVRRGLRNLKAIGVFGKVAGV